MNNLGQFGSQNGSTGSVPSRYETNLVRNWGRQMSGHLYLKYFSNLQQISEPQCGRCGERGAFVTSQQRMLVCNRHVLCDACTHFQTGSHCSLCRLNGPSQTADESQAFKWELSLYGVLSWDIVSETTTHSHLHHRTTWDRWATWPLPPLRWNPSRWNLLQQTICLPRASGRQFPSPTAPHPPWLPLNCWTSTPRPLPNLFSTLQPTTNQRSAWKCSSYSTWRILLLYLSRLEQNPGFSCT